MAERPILFSAAMIRALLDGRKTQTRRTRGLERFNERGQFLRMERDHRGVWCAVFRDSIPDDPCPVYVPSPYGANGDRLWVRETWGLPPSYDPKKHGDLRTRPRIGPVCFAADYTSAVHAWDGGKWRPSIHMPRWASRITLEVTGVRVERLQALTEADAKAEGVRPFFEEYSGIGREQRLTSGELARDAEHRASFAVLWDTLAAGNVAAWWKSNPWVWVVEFKRVTP